MELRERLGQSADWLEANRNMHERHKHIEKDLRDAMDEIEILEQGRLEYSRMVDRCHEAKRSLQNEIDRLKEQLLIKETAANDEAEFRKRDQQTAQHITLGMTIAIGAMVEAFRKGGK